MSTDDMTVYRTVALSAVLILPGCPQEKPSLSADAGRTAEQINAASPFAIYSPLGEMALDKVTFITPAEISLTLDDLGAKWIQEMRSGTWQGVVSDSMNVYSRVGYEGGLRPGERPTEAYKAALRQRIRDERPRVRFYEVETEPSGHGGWGADPAGYAEKLKVTHEVVKSECPECATFIGGLIGWSGPFEAETNQFLEDVLAAGATFDGVEIKFHHVSATQYLLLEEKRTNTCEVLTRHGFDCASMPMVLETATHGGDPHYPDATRDPHLAIQTETEQAQGLVKIYVHGIAIGLTRIFWVDIVERADFEPRTVGTPFAQNPFNSYGLIHNPGNADQLSGKKLDYFSYKKMVEMLEGSDWKAVTHSSQGANVQLYRFPQPGRSVWVLWTDGAAGAQATVTGLTGSRARMTEAVPRFARGAEVTDYAAAFSEQLLEVASGTATVTLPAVPVYLEEVE